MTSASLGRRMLWWLLAYVVLATVVMFAAVAYLHERAEIAVWHALLDTELDAIASRTRAEPGYQWQDSDTLRLYRPGDDWPAALAGLPPGLHDGIRVDGRDTAVLVREEEGVGRLALALDITDFEALERLVASWGVAAGASLVLVTLLVAALGARRLLRPLSRLAEDIGRLRPESPRQRVAVDAHGSAELFVIADAVNGYLDRHAQFMERERMFIDTASHELRTPMAVIAGATELALQQPDMPEQARAQVQRAQRTARDVEQLISLLLVLAKDPGALARNSDRIALDELVREIVEDHRYLMRGKDLAVEVDAPAPCEVHAPIAVLQAAIGNLLRNAIENSDRGTIRVRVDRDATVSIEDPGHGMAPEEVARIYARMARNAGRGGGGIGLDLLARLSEHLGWRLQISSVPGRGTLAVLAIVGARRGR